MPPTLSDFKRTLGSKLNDRDPVNIDLLKVAAVKAADLTGHPAWDQYLAQLQAMLDEAEAELKQWVENCCNAMLTDDMRYAQRNVERFRAQVDLLKKIMNLPGQILKERHAVEPR